VLFVVSVFLFARLGMFRNSVFGFSILIIVIFIHELGHFIGMKIFKFKDVQMLFIPFLGAVVSEKTINPSSWKKAIVSIYRTYARDLYWNLYRDNLYCNSK
jgi:hypothetical protein